MRIRLRVVNQLSPDTRFGSQVGDDMWTTMGVGKSPPHKKNKIQDSYLSLVQDGCTHGT